MDSQGFVLLAVWGIFMLFFFFLLIVSIYSEWKLFEKAKYPGWYSIIPFLNYWIAIDMIYKDINKNLIFILIGFISGGFTNLLWLVRHAQVFGKSPIEGILVFIPLYGQYLLYKWATDPSVVYKGPMKKEDLIAGYF